MAEKNRVQLKRSAFNSTTAPTSLKAGELAFQQGTSSSVPARLFIGRQTDNNNPATVAVHQISTLDDLKVTSGQPFTISDASASNERSRGLSLNVDDTGIEIYSETVGGTTTYKIRLKDSGVITSKINNSAVTSDKINNKSVLYAKIQDIPGYTVIGRLTGAAGSSQSVTASSASRVLKRPASGNLGFYQVETADIATSNITNALMADDSIGTVEIINDAVTNDKLANITRGSIKYGGASNAPTDLNVKTDGYVLIGDGTDLKSVALGGDASIAYDLNTGTAKLTVNEIGGSGGLSIKGDVTSDTVSVDWALNDNDTDALEFKTGDGAGGYTSIAKIDTTNGQEKLHVVQDLVVDGDVTFNGTTTNVSSSTIIAEDNMVKLNSEATGNTVDSGWYSKYVADLGAGLSTYYRGFVHDLSSSEFALFKGLYVEPGTTIDTSTATIGNGYFGYADIKLGSITGTDNNSGFGSIDSMIIDCGTY